jgi:hypothetical protein
VSCFNKVNKIDWRIGVYQENFQFPGTEEHILAQHSDGVLGLRIICWDSLRGLGCTDAK